MVCAAKTRIGRAVLLIHDWLAVLIVACLVSIALPQAAWAYVDPSVMTYTIQALAGVAVALSAVAGVVFRRTRRALMKRFGIDEDAKKDREAPLHRIDPTLGDKALYATADDLADGQAESETSDIGHMQSKGRGKAAQFRSAAFAAFVFVFTLFIVAPLEMVAGSAGSLVVGVDQLWPVIVVTAITAAVVMTALLAALPERVFEPARIVVISLSACCWLQAMFLNRGLPSADGDTLNWGDYAIQIAVSTIVWLAFVIGSLVARRKLSHDRMIGLGATAVACALVLVQGVGLVSMLMPGSSAQAMRAEMHDYVLTERGMFTVSQQNNVIVFVLDNYDTTHLQKAVSDEPALLDRFTGFTWYKNSTAAMIPTRYGVPYLLTGQFPREGESFLKFLAERYDRSDYLSRIASTGATMGIYSDTLGLQYVSDEQAIDYVYSKAMNFTDANSLPVDHINAALMLTKCALYRDMPWALKPIFWFYTDEVNNAVLAFDEDAGLDTMPYTISDGRWYKQLKEYGLSIDGQADAPAFRFIHLLGSHRPYIIDENGIDIGYGKSTRDKQARGSMRMVGDYLDQLKKLGVYDQTTIIITADHGNYYHISTPLKEPATPIMLVKPANAPDKPLETSSVAVAAGDTMPTVLTALGADVGEYGMPIWELTDPDRSRIYLMTTSDGSHDQEILEYEISGDALDMANWKLTGRSWPAQE